MVKQSLSKSKTSLAALGVALLLIAIPATSSAQTNHDWIRLTGDGLGGTIPDWGIFPSAPNSIHNGSLGFFSQDSPLTQLNLMNDAPGGAASLGSNGLGIGFGAFNGSGFRFATAPLHVVGGGIEDAYPAGRAIVNDRNPNPGFRELLSLANDSGGGVRLSLDDGGDGNANFKLDNFNGRFNLWNDTTSQLALGVSATSTNTIEIGEGGVGIGTANPTSRLHTFSADPDKSSTITSQVVAAAGTRNRVMLNMVNSGGAFMTFTDTSNDSTWFFSNSNDELNLRKGGGGVSPAMRIKSDGEVAFVSNQLNRFQIFPNGDVRPGTGGAYLTPSDRNLKENFQTLDAQKILRKVVELPVTAWNYKDDQAKRLHIGPMAQDFHASFGLGDDETTICEMDKDGVALVAIQGLNEKVELKEKEISNLSKVVDKQTETIRDQAELIAELNARMEQLEALVVPQER